MVVEWRQREVLLVRSCERSGPLPLVRFAKASGFAKEAASSGGYRVWIDAHGADVIRYIIRVRSTCTRTQNSNQTCRMCALQHYKFEDTGAGADGPRGSMWSAEQTSARMGRSALVQRRETFASPSTEVRVVRSTSCTARSSHATCATWNEASSACQLKCQV